MKLTLLSKKSEKESEDELIALSCHTYLCKINNNTHDTMYLIKQLCRTYSITFNPQFGTVCAHISLHHSSMPIKGPPKEWVVANKIVNKFNLIFIKPQFIHKIESKSQLKTFGQIVDYGMRVLTYSLSPNFLGPLNKSKQYYQKLKAVTTKLINSLLLQFIPPQYSAAIISLYMEERQVSEKKEWAQEYHQRFEALYPYQDLYLLMHSLSMQLLNFKKLVNVQHYLTLLENPVMGTIQWPMTIGARDHFDLPPIEDEK